MSILFLVYNSPNVLYANYKQRPIFKMLHTSYNCFYKWTKISSLEIIIFELKNDGKKWSRIYFEIDRAPSELLLPSAKFSAQNGSRYLWRGSVNFKINSRPLFTVIFKLKNDNFKTRDFSPLIERVLAGVSRQWSSSRSHQWSENLSCNKSACACNFISLVITKVAHSWTAA